MKVHKRYACHRVYDSINHYQALSVVAITEEGEVIDYMPLAQETSSTEWIGGVIVLSPFPEMIHHTDFQGILDTMLGNGQTPLYAWHISDFDFSMNELSTKSIIRRL